MRNIFAVLSILFIAGCASVETNQQTNTLSRAEKREGWQLLFDGASTTEWRSPGKSTFPEKGWRVQDGALLKVGRERGGDIVTEKMYSEFDLRWDWKLQPRGNNGVKYFVTPERKGVGHEYQMIYGDHTGVHATASFYEVLPPWTNMTTALRAPGEWNSSRILVKGDRVEHWLNGQKVLEYQLGSAEVKAGIAKSKFKGVANFGERVKGYILLTDHNDECAFRNIRIRDFSED